MRENILKISKTLLIVFPLAVALMYIICSINHLYQATGNTLYFCLILVCFIFFGIPIFITSSRIWKTKEKGGLFYRIYYVLIYMTSLYIISLCIFMGPAILSLLYLAYTGQISS